MIKIETREQLDQELLAYWKLNDGHATQRRRELLNAIWPTEEYEHLQELYRLRAFPNLCEKNQKMLDDEIKKYEALI